MRSRFLIAVASLFTLAASAQSAPFVARGSYPIQSGGGWDYLSVYKGRLYVAHSTQVNILDEASGDSLAVIPNTTGVHGVAFDPTSGHGFTSNGRLNNVTVFDLKTHAVLTTIATGQNPDAIFREPYTGYIITCNGRSANLSLIDPVHNTLEATIPVGGKPETAVSDGKGKLFVNIEDKNEVVCVDLVKLAIIRRWSLDGAEGPTGLQYDPIAKRLYVGCEGKLVVLDIYSGKVVATVPIGAGCDGVAFWPKKKWILTANGQSGTLSVIRAASPYKFVPVATIPTQKGARTLALDPDNGLVFLPTADFEQAAPGERPHVVPGTFHVLVYEPAK